MKKDKFEREVEKIIDIDFSFNDINPKIDYQKFEKQKRFSFQPKIFVPIGSFVIILIAVIAILLVNNRGPKIETIMITNMEDIVTKYEKNASFIKTGVEVEKRLSNGKKEKADNDEYVIDANEFKNGLVGSYNINVYLKNKPKLKTNYSVEVINDEISQVELNDFRTQYFVGEEVIPQDIILNKLCTSGNTIEAKITEYAVDVSQYDSSTPGTYPIIVTLKSNPSFKVEFTVTVNRIEDVDLNGRYAYIDDYMQVGQPMIYALDIDNNTIISRYSEIVINGIVNKEIRNNAIYLTSQAVTQEMVYKPETRTLVVSGIAGDPDMPCFRLNRTDIIIEVTGENINDDTKYIAKDGYLTQETINYLNYFYGGVYLDTYKNMPITVDTYFGEDTEIVVGPKVAVNNPEDYIGIWYDEVGKVYFHINSGSFYYYDKSYPINFSVEDLSNGDYLLRTTDTQLKYLKSTDTLGILSPEDGTVWIELNRFNNQTHAMVSLEMNYGSHSIKEYAVEIGKPFKYIFYGQLNIDYYGIPGYNNEPITEDKYFSSVDSYSFGFSDILGIYGTLENHVRVLGSFEAGKLDTGHNYWLERVENYQRTKLGWLIWTNLDLSTHVRTFGINYEDGTYEELSYYYDNKELANETTSLILDKTPCKNLPILGTYKSDAGKIRTFNEYGGITWSETDKTGYTYYCGEGITITGISENEINGYYIEQDIHDNRVYHDITFTLVENVWSFTMNDVVYHLQKNN